MNTINNKLNDKESKEGIRRIFDFFIDVPNSDSITLNSLKKISKELEENMSDEELKIMLERASKNEVEHNFYQNNCNYMKTMGLTSFLSHLR